MTADSGFGGGCLTRFGRSERSSGIQGVWALCVNAVFLGSLVVGVLCAAGAGAGVGSGGLAKEQWQWCRNAGVGWGRVA
eukprot:15432702-Alexandrium_andersonii.AAC.3